jgi:hypothetical protein
MSMVPDFNNLVESLQWLAKFGRLSGSLGRGERSGKDIDVYLSYSKVKTLKGLLDFQMVTWDSPCTGAITWHPEGVQVEVSDLFPRYKTGDKVIYGVTFRT